MMKVTVWIAILFSHTAMADLMNYEGFMRYQARDFEDCKSNPAAIKKNIIEKISAWDPLAPIRSAESDANARKAGVPDAQIKQFRENLEKNLTPVERTRAAQATKVIPMFGQLKLASFCSCRYEEMKKRITPKNYKENDAMETEKDVTFSCAEKNI